MHSIRFSLKQPKLIFSKSLTSISGILCDKDIKKPPRVKDVKKTDNSTKLSEKVVQGVHDVTEKIVHTIEKAAETIHEVGHKKDEKSDESINKK